MAVPGEGAAEGAGQGGGGMTRDEAIIEACSIVALAYHSIGDYSHASDGFCSQCPAATSAYFEADYRNDGRALAFVRQAVVEKLERDGIVIADRFDPETGEEVVA